MSGRRFRRLLLLVVIVGVGYYIYKDHPTVTGFIDSITGPLMGSKAAVETSERNRVVGDANAAISEQSEVNVGTLRIGMTASEVRDLIGNPDRVEDEKVDGVRQARWPYTKLRRILVLQEGRVVSIIIQQ
jgi:hypothetical protein